jgi:hypothetical protein
MISFLTVLTPMLAKRTMKMTMTAVEINPPVVVVYSVSPLYRKSLLVGKRSTERKNLLPKVKKEGIGYKFYRNLNFYDKQGQRSKKLIKGKSLLIITKA